jgi:hypothetical protein
MEAMAKPSRSGHRPFEVLKELLDRDALASSRRGPPLPRFPPNLTDEEAFLMEMEAFGSRLGETLSLPAPVELPKRGDD